MNVLSVLRAVVILRTAQADGTFSLDLVLVLVVGLLIGLLAVVLVIRNQQVPITKVLNGEAHLQVLVENLKQDLATAKDDLATANRRIGALTTELGQVRIELADVQRKLEAYQGNHDNRTLLVGIGTDPGLEVDLTKLRGVRTKNGPIIIQRLLPVNSNNLSHILQVQRERGRPIRWVHLATKATPKGIEMEDGMCSGAWLSGELTDVKALLLGGCETFEVGEVVANVPVVATTLERISHNDAMTLAGVFWQAVAENLTPPEIEARCREGLPARLSEMIYIRY